jgi:hypothetical protein
MPSKLLVTTLASLNEVQSVDLSGKYLNAEDVLMLAHALKSNTSVTTIILCENAIGDEGATAFVDALEVNTSVTHMDLDDNQIAADHVASIKELIDRNKRFRRLFLFDARKMLLSLMCADECGVVWPYLLKNGDKGIVAPDNVESVRAEFAGVVAERRRRLQVAPAAKRRRLE